MTYPLTQASSRLGELVSRARFGRERLTITEHGRPVAVIISVDDLEELQRAQDAADLALCRQVRAEPGAGMAHEEFMAALEAEDVQPG